MDSYLRQEAEFHIKERDRQRKLAAEHPELQELVAYAKGRADAHDLALAWIAGGAGYARREQLEAALQPAELGPVGGWEPRS